jgi:hypothetical protein
VNKIHLASSFKKAKLNGLRLEKKTRLYFLQLFQKAKVRPFLNSGRVVGRAGFHVNYIGGIERERNAPTSLYRMLAKGLGVRLEINLPKTSSPDHLREPNRSIVSLNRR